MVDVILSPSSQTANQYAGGADGVEDSEHRWMRELTPLLHDLLQRNGINSQVLWSTNLATRIAESNKVGPLLHLAIHSNAGGGTGSGFFIYGPGGKSEPIARAMADAMAPVTPTRDLGVVVYNHYETRATTSPAVIAEVAFHDNATEAQWIRTHLREISVGLARGVIAGLAAAYGGKFTDIAARPLIIDGGGGMAPVVVAPAPTTPTSEEDDMFENDDRAKLDTLSWAVHNTVVQALARIDQRTYAVNAKVTALDAAVDALGAAQGMEPGALSATVKQAVADALAKVQITVGE